MLQRLQRQLPLFAFLLCGSLFAQNGSVGLAVAPIDVRSDTLEITWVPNSASAWERLSAEGYRVERYTLTNSPDANPPSETFWEASVFGAPGRTSPEAGDAYRAAPAGIFKENAPQGSFNAAMFDYLYIPLEEIDSSNDTVRREFLQAQYEMAAFGAFRAKGESAALLGLRHLDTGLDTNGIYLYRIVSVADPSVRQDIYVDIAGTEAVVRSAVPLSVEFRANSFNRIYSNNEEEYQMVARAKAYGDSIVLRWAPLSPELLRNSHRAAYKIQRGDYLDIPSAVQEIGQTSDSIRFGDSIMIAPWTEQQFADYFQSPGPKDSMVLVAAQVLYGDLQSEPGLEEREALENLFAFGLQAADQSPLAATALGLRYVDRNVSGGESYDYLVEMLLDSIDPYARTLATYLTVENVYASAPELLGLEALEGEYAIGLVLEARNSNNYDRYVYERFDEATNTWLPLTDGPVRFEVDETLEIDGAPLLYQDSVAVLYQPYRYRVRGENALNETSPWAEITAIARDRTAPDFPQIDTVYATTESSVRIEWNGADSERAPDLSHYMVRTGSSQYVENLRDISPRIPRGTRSFNYLLPEGTKLTADSAYFFTVYAVDTAGNESGFIPLALNIIDSIAPAPPVGLAGNINDSTGIATIAWQPSPESDILGYQVYFSDDTTDVFSQITTEDLYYNLYLDTVELNTMNDFIYYRVTAFDKHFNMSEYSQILTVQRPDIVPPTPPLQLLPIPTGQAIELTWEPSSSDDAETYRILRRSNELIDGEFEPWQLVDSVPATELAFADTSAAYEVAYQYMILTVDDADLVSEDGNLQTGRRIFTADVGGVGAVTVSLASAATENEGARVQVQWDYVKPSIPLLRDADHRFMLYRALNDEVLTRYKQLRSKDPVYVDTDIETGTTYRYALMVVYDNGKKSELSTVDSVTIPVVGE